MLVSFFYHLISLYNQIYLAENGLSFVETSALDSSNVEVAFQQILNGKKAICSYVLEMLDAFVSRNLQDCLKEES